MHWFLSIFALLMMDRFLRNSGETGVLGQIRNVAVHLPVNFDILRDSTVKLLQPYIKRRDERILPVKTNKKVTNQSYDLSSPFY